MTNRLPVEVILDGLFTEILSECSDEEETTFQENSCWCPMKPKKDAIKPSPLQKQKVQVPLVAMQGVYQ